MANSLGGIVWCHNAISQDYNIIESIRCLEEFCDQVIVVDAGSIDGTTSFISKQELAGNITFISLPYSLWMEQRGHQKLAYFQNLAKKYLNTDYYFCLQADECVHENSYQWIKLAVQQGEEAYMCSRINLWGSPYMQLNVPHNRKPCNDRIIRLAKVEYDSIGDGESIGAFASEQYVDQIKIYHFGFVRKREVMVEKIRHMQAEVFETTVDAKLEGMKIFDPYAWFDKDKDLKPIDEPLPKIMEQWARLRDYRDEL